MTRQTPLQVRWRDAREAVADAREFLVDWWRFVRWAAPSEGRVLPDDDPAHVAAQVEKDAHRVEKGLAVPEPRRPFGEEPTRRLEVLLPAPMGGTDGPGWAVHGREALAARDLWNRTGDRDAAGLAPVAGAWAGLDPAVLQGFFRSRHSVRDFAGPVTVAEVRAAAHLAQSSPSVCNRQAPRVHAYLDKRDADALLALHRGSAGFAHLVPSLAIVTVDLRLFTGAGERNQGWIDGGLFAMSFVWALHGAGLGSCMLNWSRTNADTAALRSRAGIPEHEDGLLMVAMGRPTPGGRRTRSARRPLDEVLTLHGHRD